MGRLVIALLFPALLLADVTVRWKDSQGRTVYLPHATYSVYRASGACAATNAYVRIAEGLADLRYVDTDPLDGVSCYYVTAVSGGAESIPSARVEIALRPPPPTAVEVSDPG